MQIRCKDWAKGECPRGDACPYGHLGQAGQAMIMQEVVPEATIKSIWESLDENVQAQLASELQEWIVDSGASRHFLCRKAILPWEVISKADSPMRVNTANGTVQVTDTVVRYLPLLQKYVRAWVLDDASSNLLSVGTLVQDEDGPEIEFRINRHLGAHFVLQDGSILKCDCSGRLPALNVEPLVEFVA